MLSQLKLTMALDSAISDIDEYQAGCKNSAVKKAIALNSKLQVLLSELSKEEMEHYLAESSGALEALTKSKGRPSNTTEKAVLAEILRQYVEEYSEEPTFTKIEPFKTSAMKFCQEKLVEHRFDQYKSLKIPHRKIITAIEDYQKNS